MAADKDWKAEYTKTLDELETKEAEWQQIDSLLRKTISRLSIAGRGFDARLDGQLKHIQELARDKKDARLSDALEKLSRVVATLDDSPLAPAAAPVAQETQKFANDPSILLLALLQEIQFKENQRGELKSICADLIGLLGSGKSQAAVKPQVLKLASLINSNIGNEANCLTIDAATPTMTTDFPINEVLNMLLEKLAIIHCTSDSMKRLRNESFDKIDESDWQDTLNQIITCITETLDRLNREKSDLEDFIVKVTQQLVTISDVIVADKRDQRSDQEDCRSLQHMMQDSVKSIEDDCNNASEIGHLKNVVAQNLHQIQSGVEGFVNRANQRHEAIDERNSHLVAQIEAMDQKTRLLKKKLDENREKLLFDTLTGVGSRLAYDETLKQELARWQRHGEGFSYAILDIDHFKKINDKYGHSAGDNALKIVARKMIKQIRKSDTIFRIGGEEFVLLLPNTSVDKADSLVKKLRETITSSSIHCNQERVVLTLSAGITEPQENDIVKSLYERADKALYRAKNSGRNCQFIG
ncbi:MAG: GGDEF domain-containing protein [Gammaproteobacteria bacterium]|nr:GGDEF domain-containing protein [Gammaproteobacteria bacterium]